ncbi:MAG: hypothetical protein MR929_01030 [Sutterella wadsworthensis]|nr:hypothetical protein [Sutterella wadsworthensis]
MNLAPADGVRIGREHGGCGSGCARRDGGLEQGSAVDLEVFGHVAPVLGKWKGQKVSAAWSRLSVQ